jgi:hypothetical protein
MSAPPEAHSEYSRGSEAFRRLTRPRRRGALGPAQPGYVDRPAGTGAVVIVAVLGALLVLVAQFIALYHVRVATTSIPIKTVGTGGNHGWAPVPIALVALALAAAVHRYGNRTALLGLAVLGVATLLIALLDDLPDAHSTGLVGSSASTFVQGAASPGVGLYMETLGAVLLLVSGGVGFLMLGQAPPADATAGDATAPDATASDARPRDAPPPDAPAPAETPPA